LLHWKYFFEQLSDYEIRLNNAISQQMQQENLSLRFAEQRSDYFKRINTHFSNLTKNMPSFFSACSPCEEFRLECTIAFGKDWPL